MDDNQSASQYLAECDRPEEPQASAPLNLLWVVGFEYSTRLHDGGVLRFTNFSRELLLRGHRVYIAFCPEPDHRQESLQWLESLKQQKIITDYFELSYSPDPRHLRISARLMHPTLGNRALREAQSETTRAAADLVQKLGIDLIIMSNRPLVFLSVTLPHTPCIVDFCDCMPLYLYREVQYSVSRRRYWEALRMLPRIVQLSLHDGYYARQSTANLLVSPIDQRAMSRISGTAAKNFTILNGVALPRKPVRPAKLRNRLIFTGNMNFPPNCNAALWFLDNVFPLVRVEVPDAGLVLAGANPPQVLQRRASPNVMVTGYVKDLSQEIAQSSLYVAPLKSGSGFKNKIVEAVVNRTYPVATSVAVEFLDPYTRSLIAVADSPQEMAETIVRLLRDPAACEVRLEKLYEHVSANFSWAKRTEELLEMVEQRVGRKPRPSVADATHSS